MASWQRQPRAWRVAPVRLSGAKSCAAFSDPCWGAEVKRGDSLSIRGFPAPGREEAKKEIVRVPGKIAKWGLALFGVFLILQELVPAFLITHSFSVSFPVALGVAVIVLAWTWGRGIAWLKRTRRKKVEYAIYGMVGVFVVSFIFVESLIIFHRTQEPSPSDVVIVLGAGLLGDKPSWILENRLDCAAEYLQSYPNTIAVVSGGKGSGETATEASAMKKYLVEKGVSPERVMMEDKSSTTVENFKFSKKMLDEKLGVNNYSVSYITNKFHVYRAGLIAKKAGLAASGIAAKDVYVVMLSNYSREYFALMKYFALSTIRDI